MSTDCDDLDPRIQIELESLNSTTEEINKLEIELEEANCTFRILLNEATRRLKLLSQKLGSNCIEKARGYHDARECLRQAQVDCQAATWKFRRANEIYVAAKETVALAEQQFMTNSHEWQFDNAWQEMLNHATIKVMTAEQQKTECHAEYSRIADVFNAAEQKVTQVEMRFRRSIRKSQPYFDAKQICQDQLNAQKQRIQELQQFTRDAKARYAGSLRSLERISDDIHQKRTAGANAACPSNPAADTPPVDAQPPSMPSSPPPPFGRREPGVGAESSSYKQKFSISTLDVAAELERCCGIHDEPVSPSPSNASDRNILSRAVSLMNVSLNRNSPMADRTRSTATLVAASSELDLEQLRDRVRELAVRPVQVGDGQPASDRGWESELNETVNQLDRLMMIRETTTEDVGKQTSTIEADEPAAIPSPVEEKAVVVVQSVAGVPLLTRWSNEIAQRTKRFQIARRLSLD